MLRISSLLILILLVNATLSLCAQIEAIPDRTRVGLDESFTLELRAKGSLDGDPDLSQLERDFELLGRSQSSQVQIINGDFSRTTSWILTLMARSAGSKEIPSLCIGSDCSKPVKIEVLPAGENNALSVTNDLFLEVSSEPDKLWVQSQLLYKVKLYTRLNFLQASLSEPEPVGTEAVVQKLGEDRSYDVEREGLRYRIVERDYVIFPQQSGQLTIPPIRFGAQVAEAGRRGFDPFNQRTRQIRKSSEEITMEVLPAPESDGRRWLPASDLQLLDDWQQPPQLTVGEPATRTLTLRAKGVPSAQLPSLSIEIPDGFRSYPDQPTREDQFNSGGVLGTLQQKLALVPTRPGTLHLPEIKIDWWDLDDERWHQASLPAVDVEVLPAANQPDLSIKPPTVVQEPLQEEDEPQVEIPASTMPRGYGIWPWLSLTLGCGWLLTLLFIVKGKLAQRRHKKTQNQRDVTTNIKAARKILDQALTSGDPTRVRSALLDWGAALFPQHPPGNLEELSTLCGTPMKQELEAFSKSLYSRETVAWESHGMMEALQKVERELTERKGVDKLPPLYPH